MIRGVVFDLDDTLYYERDYVHSGFAHVAATVADSSAEAQALANWLDERFEAGLRGDAFDRLLAAFPEIALRTTVEAMIDAYRHHRPAIALAPDVEAVLIALQAQDFRLGVISDGAIDGQLAKSEALGLDRWFDPVLFTASLGPAAGKPATTAYEAIAARWGMLPNELAYVADNPDKDFVGPRSLGWLTVRLRRVEQLRWANEATSEAFRPDVEIPSMSELLGRLVSYA